MMPKITIIAYSQTISQSIPFDMVGFLLDTFFISKL